MRLKDKVLNPDGQLDSDQIPANAVGLSLLLDTLTASSELWKDMPDPLPLFAHELETGLVQVLGVGNG